ncbi:MAG TPA: MarR family winged helix-turn-helix transcriptional regulator, partial [Actinomycetota bacterium]|nr:MarR family winged helix-turn-helix transcriptional regulator [Actinomycetota bacterium]
HDFVERVAARGEFALPLSLVRTLAWLVVCEPPHQSAEQLQSQLRLSAGSVSAATSTMVRAGIVARRTVPGDRRTFYELDPQGWRRLLAGRLAMLTQVRGIAESALVVDEGNNRLQAMRELFAACEAGLAPVLGEGGERDGRKRTKGRKKNR